jgi:two-component system, OmpR family, sensor histidine kinase ChvG
MTLKRQLLLVSLLTLVLPWAGYRFIHETESALRSGQQQMLAGTARAIADSLAKYPDEFPDAAPDGPRIADQIYGHPLEARPEIDGYVDDWTLDRAALHTMRGMDGPVRFALGIFDQAVYLYVEVADKHIVYLRPETVPVGEESGSGRRYSDRVELVSSNPPYLENRFTFAAEAPGQIITRVDTANGPKPQPTILAQWQDVPGGYQVEARIPAALLGTHLGAVVFNTADDAQAPVRSSSYTGNSPGMFVRASPELTNVAASLVQPGMRLIVTDAAGWRIAQSGALTTPEAGGSGIRSAWPRIIYDALVESGEEASLAEPDVSGLEQQGYIVAALRGSESAGWFRSGESGRAVVAVAQPIRVRQNVIGTVILQQGTDAILSLTNEGLARLINVTLIATILVAVTLLGYATWLSRRIRRLSVAAERALDGDGLRVSLPSAGSRDEVGDLSRSFSHVLQQLGDYNDYLRTLASKLSHELRTPLAIVTSSLENLEHEPLNDASASYAARARDGADRLRRILTAMSEASRVEELMQHVEPERFDLKAALDSAVAAYRDVYAGRRFVFVASLDAAPMSGSPELLIQMLDKLVDNAVDFSTTNDTITVRLDRQDGRFVLGVENPGPPLPSRMRSQLFDSMVSMRPGSDNRHLGLGLYVAKLIAEGHRGKIEASNTEDGVAVVASLPGEPNGE